MTGNALHRKSAAQSAMEFLITYGWAILIIAVVLAGLFQFGVFAPSLPNTCLSSTPFECQNPILGTTGTLSVTIGQLGTTMTLTGLNCTSGSTIPTHFIAPQSNIVLTSGGIANVNFTCPLSQYNATGVPFSGKIWIQYTTPFSASNVLTQQVAVVTASVSVNGTTSTSVSSISSLSSTSSVSSSSTSSISSTSSTSSTTSSTSTTTTILPVQPYIVNTLILPTTYSDSSPYWVAISPASQVYITDSWNNSVDVYNSVTLNLVRIIPVGDYPRGITISPNGALAYAMNWGDGTVSVINTAAGSAVSLVVLDTSDPMFAAFSQDGTHAYVSCTNGNSKGKIDVVNVASNSVASDIAMLDGPINNSSAITPLARTLLPDPIFPAISGPIHYPLGIATSPRGGLVYAIDGGNSSIEVINTTSQSVTKWTKDAGIGTTGIILSPDGSQAYVEDGYTLLLQDFNTITSSYADTSATLGIQTEGIAMTPDGKYIYVVNEGGGGGSTVSVISTSNYTTVDTIALTGVETAQGIAITPNGQEAFVTNPEYEGYQGSVTVINTGTDN